MLSVINAATKKYAALYGQHACSLKADEKYYSAVCKAIAKSLPRFAVSDEREALIEHVNNSADDLALYGNGVPLFCQQALSGLLQYSATLGPGLAWVCGSSYPGHPVLTLHWSDRLPRCTIPSGLFSARMLWTANRKCTVAMLVASSFTTSSCVWVTPPTG